MNALLKVVDASLALKWMVEEEYSNEAHALSLDWRNSGIQIIAPYLMLAEVANALHRKVADGIFTLEFAAQTWEGLNRVEIEFYNPLNVHAGAVRIANRLGQGAVYDSVYLALAERLDCEFWTADRRFYRAARSAFPDRVRWIGETAAQTTVSNKEGA